jgi:hypothetical protein
MRNANKMATKTNKTDTVDVPSYNKGWDDATAEAKTTAPVPQKDEFGEVAKALVIAVGSIAGAVVALVMIWQFIHWAATPDFSELKDKLGYIEDTVNSTNMRVGEIARQQQTNNSTSSAVGTFVPGTSATVLPMQGCRYTDQYTVTCNGSR